MTEQYEPFCPDWISPPGETIEDLLEERGWSQADLSEHLGYPTKLVSQLLKGKVPLTEEIALRLEQVIGGPARFWLASEANYRAACARRAAAS